MKWPVRQIIFRSLVGLGLLGISIFIVWRMRLVSDVRNEFAAIRAAGFPTTGEEANFFYTKVPDAENGAIKMEMAFNALTNYPDHRSNEVAAIKFPLQKKTLTVEQLELIAGYLAINSNALALAREGIKFPRSRYPIDLSLGAETLLPHLPKLKVLTHLADFQANLNPESSADAVETILGLAHTLDTEPVLISKLVRIALINEAVTICERRLNGGEANENELARVDKLFAATIATNQIASGLAGDRAMYARYFRMSWADIKKFPDAGGRESSSNSNIHNSKSQPLFLKLTGFFERDLRFYLHSMETNIALAEKFPKNVEAISNAKAQMEQVSRNNYYIFSSLLMPAINSTIFKEATGLAQIRMAQTGIAVERFRLANRNLPKKLDQLVPQFLPAMPEDPCDGQPLRFRLLEHGYLIYSVGKDGQDNGGRERPANAKSSYKTPYDITFTVER